MPLESVSPEKVGVKVGDFFVSSWGYDQTNVDFYRVVGVTAKSVRVQQWQTKVDHSDIHDYVVPDPDGEPHKGAWVKVPDGWSEYDPEVVETLIKRLQTSGDRPCFRVASYANAYLWDGTPQYRTGSGYGH